MHPYDDQFFTQVMDHQMGQSRKRQLVLSGLLEALGLEMNNRSLEDLSLDALLMFRLEIMRMQKAEDEFFSGCAGSLHYHWEKRGFDSQTALFKEEKNPPTPEEPPLQKSSECMDKSPVTLELGVILENLLKRVESAAEPGKD